VGVRSANMVPCALLTADPCRYHEKGHGRGRSCLCAMGAQPGILRQLPGPTTYPKGSTYTSTSSSSAGRDNDGAAAM
jgi:hypothetical protein